MRPREKLSTCRTQGVKAVFDRCGLQRCLMALPPLRYNSTKLPSYSAYKETCSDDSEPLTWFVPLGIALGSFGSVGINLGNNLQSLGLTKLASEMALHLEKLEQDGYEIDSPTEKLPPPPFLTRGRIIFIGGSTIFGTASIINFVAFAFAPASILAPLEAIQVVCQLFMGRLIHKTPITRLAAVSTAVTCSGVVGAVSAVPPVVYEFTMPQLVALWAAPAWMVFLVAVIVLSAVLQVVHRIYLAAEKRKKPLPLSAAITPVTYAVSAAIIGALSVAQAKALSEVVSLLFPPCIINVLTEPFLYMTLFLLAACGGIWLNRSVAALGLYDPNFIIPLLQSSYIVFATISGGVFFQEFNAMSSEPWRWPVFIGGLVVMLFGLYGLFVAGFRAGKAKEQEMMSKIATPSRSPELPWETPAAASAVQYDDSPKGCYTPNYGGADAADQRNSSESRSEGEAADQLGELTTPAAAAGSRPASGAPSTGTSRVSFKPGECGASGGSGSACGLQTPAPRRSSSGRCGELSRTSSSGGRSGSSRASSRGLSVYQESVSNAAKSTPTGSLAEVLAQRRESKRLLSQAVGSASGGERFMSRGSIFHRPSMTPQRKSLAPRPGDSWYQSEPDDEPLSIPASPRILGPDPAPAGSIRRGSSVAAEAAAAAAMAEAAVQDATKQPPLPPAPSTPAPATPGAASTPGGTPILESNATPLPGQGPERI